MGFGGMASTIQAQLVPALREANKQTDRLIEQTRVARDEQRAMSDDMRKLKEAAASFGSQLASEGFGSDGSKTGGFATAAEALEIVKEYAGWLQKSKDQINEAVRLTGPGIQESMFNLEQFFLRFFPQFGNITKLAKEYMQTVEQSAEEFNAAAARTRDVITASSASGAAFTPIDMPENPEMVAAKEELNVISEKVKEIKKDLEEDKALADARKRVDVLRGSIEDLRHELEEDPISRELLADLEAIAKKRSELRDDAPSLELRTARLNVRDAQQRLVETEALIENERDVRRLAELKRDRQQIESELTAARKSLAEAEAREKRAAGSAELKAIELERLDIEEARRRLELDTRQKSALAQIKELEQQSAGLQKQVAEREREGQRRIRDLERREEELKQTVSDADEKRLKESTAKATRVAESMGDLERVLSERLFPQVERLEAVTRQFVTSTSASAAAVAADALSAANRIAASDGVMSVTRLPATASPQPAVGERRQTPSARVTAPSSARVTAPPTPPSATRPPAANPATGRT